MEDNTKLPEAWLNAREGHWIKVGLDTNQEFIGQLLGSDSDGIFLHDRWINKNYIVYLAHAETPADGGIPDPFPA